MERIIQKVGMDHLRILKKEAEEIHKNDFNGHPDMWIDAVETVLIRHRMDMATQFQRGDLIERGIDRRKWEVIENEMVREQEKLMWDASIAFNGSADFEY